MERRKVTARWQRGAVIACGLLALAAAAADHAEARPPGEFEKGPRGGERSGVATTPQPQPQTPTNQVGEGTLPPPGPIQLPVDLRPVREMPGPNRQIMIQPPQPQPQPLPLLPPAMAAPLPKAPTETTRDTTTSSAGAPSTSSGSRITEIIPPLSATAPAAFALDPSTGRPLLAADAWASVDPCVNVFVRSSKVDGREVVSVDLHGDGLIKGAVSPHLAGQLLARAGQPAGAGGARAACVPPALAQSLFSPVVNVATLDPALRMVRVGDRWVLAGSREPVQLVKPQPLQLAAATTTRGRAKKPTKSSNAPAKPRPVQVSYNIYP